MNTSARRGFTLLELTTVIVIIGILCSIAMPNFLNAKIKARLATATADMQLLRLAINAYDVDTGAPPPTRLQPGPFRQAQTASTRWQSGPGVQGSQPGTAVDLNAFLALMAAQQAAADGKTVTPPGDVMTNAALLRGAGMAEGQAVTAEQRVSAASPEVETVPQTPEGQSIATERSISAASPEVEAASPETLYLGGLALEVLVRPAPYLSQLPRAQFFYTWGLPGAATGSVNLEAWQLYVYGNVLEVSPEGYLLPGSIKGRADYVVCCPGPGTEGELPPAALDEALMRATYDPTNGIMSRGELTVLGP